MKSEVLEIVDAHAVKAANSQYDQGVCVNAISVARKTIMAVPADLSPGDYKAQLLQDLTALFVDYHDPDGEYTSGKGVIGSLLDDIRNAV